MMADMDPVRIEIVPPSQIDRPDISPTGDPVQPSRQQSLRDAADDMWDAITRSLNADLAATRAQQRSLDLPSSLDLSFGQPMRDLLLKIEDAFQGKAGNISEREMTGEQMMFAKADLELLRQKQFSVKASRAEGEGEAGEQFDFDEGARSRFRREMQDQAEAEKQRRAEGEGETQERFWRDELARERARAATAKEITDTKKRRAEGEDLEQKRLDDHDLVRERHRQDQQRKREQKEEQQIDDTSRRLIQDPANQILGRIHGRDQKFDRDQDELEALKDLQNKGLLDAEETKRMGGLEKELEGGTQGDSMGGLGQLLGQLVGGKGGAGLDKLLGKGGTGAVGAAGAGGAAGAVGAAGAGVAIWTAIDEQIQKAIKAIVPIPGQTIGAVGSLDPGRAAENINSALEKLPWNMLFGGLAIAEFNRSFMGAIGEIEATAKRLGPYSGPLATQLGFAEARSTLGDIERAGILGPQLAEFTEAKSRLEQEAMTTLAKLATPLIPILTNALKNLLKFLEWFEPFLISAVNDGIDTANTGIDIAQKILEIFGIVNVTLRHIDRIATAANQPQGDKFLDELLATLNMP